jgi:hypothetical protein
MEHPNESSSLGGNKLLLEQLTSHLKKIVTKDLEGVYDELDMKESKEAHRSRKHAKEKMHPSPRVSEGIPSPFLNAYDIDDPRVANHVPKQLRGSTSHRTHSKHHNMHEVSSDSDDEPHESPRHPRNRHHRHLHGDNRHDGPRPNARNVHGNVLDEIPRFGDHRLENRYLGVKLEIPTFDGNVNPEKYLEWEMRLDQIFEAQRFDDERRIALATVHLTNYALLWWDNHKKTVMPWHPIHSWEELKARFRVRWVPPHYVKELHRKLQTISSKSVEEYYREMWIALTRANIQEQEESTMARFLDGLHPRIRDIVELHDHASMEALLHQSQRVESQLLR